MTDQPLDRFGSLAGKTILYTGAAGGLGLETTLHLLRVGARVVAIDNTPIKAEALRGVHLGTKTGRSPGIRLGYSQIANPAYLIGKGTMAPRRAVRQMVRNVAANLVKSLRPEPWIDRRGRLKGNILGLWDLLRRRARPDRILEL